MDYFDQIPALLKLFWFIAIPTSVFFLIQTVMTFIGADASDGTSSDFDSDMDQGDSPFQLFSLRNLIHFLLGFSWTGISFYSIIKTPALLIGVALLIGILFVLVIFLYQDKYQNSRKTIPSRSQAPWA